MTLLAEGHFALGSADYEREIFDLYFLMNGDDFCCCCVWLIWVLRLRTLSPQVRLPVFVLTGRVGIVVGPDGIGRRTTAVWLRSRS